MIKINPERSQSEYRLSEDKPSCEQNLQQENQELKEQVKRLVRVERSMLEVQEKLDEQINFYRQLNEIAKRLKSTFDVEDILKTAIEFILYDLNFEHCLILRYEPLNETDAIEVKSPQFRSFVWGGYEEEQPTNVTLSMSEWEDINFSNYCDENQDFMLSFLDAPNSSELRKLLNMDEFILCSIQLDQDHPSFLIAIGNGINRPDVFSRVTEKADYLVVLSNLLSQLSGAIVQALLYQSTRQQSERLKATLEQLRSTQSQLIQTEKMSSLGQLVAGIAHEINNPINFISGNSTHAKTYASSLLRVVSAYQELYPQSDAVIQELLEEIDFDFLKVDFPKVISSIRMGSDRIKEIVLSLRNFSRMDESEFKCVNLHEGIDSTWLILQHRLKITSERPAIRLIKEYSELPLIECAAGLVNQVFMNLLSNAIDAVESAYQQNLIQQPEITINTSIERNGVLIRIIDNGTGIPENVRHRLFDPFFTTKPVGKGTGLGLSISYQIITERHQGYLECHSTFGEGSEFRVWLPLKLNST